MLKIVVILSFALAFAGCAEPVPDPGPDGGVSQGGEGTGQVEQANTVCGVPERCNNYTCVVQGGFVVCDYNGLGDLGCQIACGTSFAMCAEGDFPLTSCENQCTGSVNVLQCEADCVNAAQYACVTGIEP
ncbi:MAG TPA: hypothetical protein VFT22_07605 [Kofleriaceae bacterium]|nr:hypothetical protein [Kofleriaceae bacterium]